MAHQSVTCIVLDGNTVLLQLREDFRIWGFPGGGVEPGERWEDAAVRETWEETGYQTELVRLVGEYTRPDYLPGEVKYVSVGRVIGGEARPDPRESLEVRWFPIDALPKRILPGSDIYLEDALKDAPPIRRVLRMPRWKAMAWRAAFRLRDLRNAIFRREAA